MTLALAGRGATSGSPRDVAEHQVAWWSLEIVQDPTGTPSHELYRHFAEFCQARRPNGCAEVPTQTMWGRVLTETYGFGPRHTESGKRRPLRVARPDGSGR